MKGFSVLDLPEPLRSQALAERGMTAEEFEAHMAGLEANERELDRMVEAGEIPTPTDMHYGDADVPTVVVVKRQPA
jgi:hypothetical protein